MLLPLRHCCLRCAGACCLCHADDITPPCYAMLMLTRCRCLLRDTILPLPSFSPRRYAFFSLMATGGDNEYATFQMPRCRYATPLSFFSRRLRYMDTLRCRHRTARPGITPRIGRSLSLRQRHARSAQSPCLPLLTLPSLLHAAPATPPSFHAYYATLAWRCRHADVY